MTPMTAEAISLIKSSAQELQLHADEATRLSRHIIGHESASVLAALRLMERNLDEPGPGEIVDWCATHASVWSDQTCENPHIGSCRQTTAYVEVRR